MFNFPTIKQAPLLGLLGSGGGNAQGARKSTDTGTDLVDFNDIHL